MRCNCHGYEEMPKKKAKEKKTRTGTVCWRGRKEEEPPVLLPTRRRQFFQIEHLAQWHAPECENVFVKVVGCAAGEGRSAVSKHISELMERFLPKTIDEGTA